MQLYNMDIGGGSFWLAACIFSWHCANIERPKLQCVRMAKLEIARPLDQLTHTVFPSHSK